MRAQRGQQRAQRPGTLLGTTINSCHDIDGVAHTWQRRGGKQIGPDRLAHTLISLIVQYLIYSQKTLLQS